MEQADEREVFGGFQNWLLLIWWALIWHSFKRDTPDLFNLTSKHKMIHQCLQKHMFCRNLDTELSRVSNTIEYLEYLDMELQDSKYVCSVEI